MCSNGTRLCARLASNCALGDRLESKPYTKLKVPSTSLGTHRRPAQSHTSTKIRVFDPLTVFVNDR